MSDDLAVDGNGHPSDRGIVIDDFVMDVGSNGSVVLRLKANGTVAATITLMPHVAEAMGELLIHRRELWEKARDDAYKKSN